MSTIFLSFTLYQTSIQSIWIQKKKKKTKLYAAFYTHYYILFEIQ